MSGPTAPIDESRPRDDELEALASDVVYEIEMFRHSARRISSSFGRDPNAFREAMLIHARCLMDFFLCDGRKDDLEADRYAHWDPANDGGPELEWLENNLGTLIDKRVAHLTAYRQRVPKEAHLLVLKIQNELTTVVNRFLDKLHPDKRPWFDKLLS
jgi:hypothetical protein